MFHRLHTCKDGSEISLWNNPYLSFEASRKLRLNSLYLGNVFHLNNWLRNNLRINLWEKFAGNKGFHVDNNLLLKYKQFYLSKAASLRINQEHINLDEKVLLGYQNKEHSASLTL